MKPLQPGARRGSRKRVQLLVGAVAVGAVVAVAIVAPLGASASATGRGATGAALVAQAKQVVAAATKGLVAAKNPSQPELTLDVTDFVPVHSWTGPKDKAIAPKGKNVQVISCATVAPACANLAAGAVSAAKALGWKATYLDGKASIQGYVTAFQTALNANPDAIVTVALPESQLQTYIAQAHEKGIPVVGITVTPEKISNPKGHYDSYVPFREDSNALLEAIWTIADSNGTAKVAFMWDKGYPFLVRQLAGEKKLFARCTGCKIVDTVYREFATAANPVRMQQIATALLQRHPDIQYVICPYGLNCGSIALAAKALGRNIKVVSKNADPNNVSLVAKGVLAEEVGSSTEWSGWSAIDDVIRLMNGKKPLGLAAHNVPLHYFVKSNAPASGKYDYGRIFDFRTAYLKLWGRK
jgi:ribose transport system substrate-binding protein